MRSMRIGGIRIFVAVLLFAHATSAAAQQVVTWKGAVDATAPVTAGGTTELVLDATIEPGWKLYALTQEPGGPQPLVIATPAQSPLALFGAPIGPLPFIAPDPNFNIDTHSHTEAATFYVPLSIPADGSGVVTGTVTLTYQTCTDRFCLPAVTDTVTIALRVPGTGADATVTVASGAVVAGSGTANVEDMAASSTATSLAGYLALAALMGALSLLTPCVFPMVPITVSYFTARAERGSRTAVSDALLYGAGIVLTFAGVGLVIALGFGAAGLNQFAANPWLNLAITALFLTFALSLFGVFNLTLPSSWLTRASGAERGRGRVAGTLLMALAFTLTSFTCTAPFLGTLLVVAAAGDWQWPLAGLVTFASVFAIPFVVLAWAPHRLAQLPRAGGWLLSVKAVMGLLELGAAFKFLSNVDLIWNWGIFTRPVVLTAWTLLALVLVAYLAGVLRLGHAPRLSRPGALRLAGTALTAVLAVYLASGLAGRRLGELEAFLPPGDLGGGQHGELAWIVNDYEAALTAARQTGQPVLVDFTGYTCTNCRWMEANMFTEPEVEQALSRFVRVRLYTDGVGETYTRFQQMQREVFGTVALPYYAVLQPTGTPVVAFGGLTRDRARFVAFLQRGLQE